MTKLLMARASIITFFKRYEIAILFILKFVIGVSIFMAINSISLHNNALGSALKPPILFATNMALGLLFTILPLTLSYLLMIIATTISFSSSVEVLTIICLFLLCVLFLYASLFKKESLFIVATIVAFYFRVPYLIPILAGLYFGISTIIPISIGVIMWNLIPVMTDLATKNNRMPTGILDFASYPKNIILVYSSIFSDIIIRSTIISEITVFMLVIVVVYIIRKLSINYSKELAIFMGGFTSIIGFIILSCFIDLSFSIGSMIFMNIICIMIAYIVKFFDVLVDYKCAEILEFQDEEFYYYVKAIPKIKIDIKTTNDKSLVSTLDKSKDISKK